MQEHSTIPSTGRPHQGPSTERPAHPPNQFTFQRSPVIIRHPLLPYNLLIYSVLQGGSLPTIPLKDYGGVFNRFQGNDMAKVSLSRSVFLYRWLTSRSRLPPPHTAAIRAWTVWAMKKTR
jgi:hypothetical protein